MLKSMFSHVMQLKDWCPLKWTNIKTGVSSCNAVERGVSTKVDKLNSVYGYRITNNKIILANFFNICDNIHMEKANFASRFRYLRKEIGYSMRQMAGCLDVGKTIIGQWESGKKEPNLVNLVAIAEFFDVSIDWLVGRENSVGSDL